MDVLIVVRIRLYCEGLVKILNQSPDIDQRASRDKLASLSDAPVVTICLNAAVSGPCGR